MTTIGAELISDFIKEKKEIAKSLDSAEGVSKIGSIARGVFRIAISKIGVYLSTVSALFIISLAFIGGDTLIMIRSASDNELPRATTSCFT